VILVGLDALEGIPLDFIDFRLHVQLAAEFNEHQNLTFRRE